MARYFHSAVSTKNYMFVIGGRATAALNHRNLRGYVKNERNVTMVAYDYTCNLWIAITSPGRLLLISVKGILNKLRTRWTIVWLPFSKPRDLPFKVNHCLRRSFCNQSVSSHDNSNPILQLVLKLFRMTMSLFKDYWKLLKCFWLQYHCLVASELTTINVNCIAEKINRLKDCQIVTKWTHKENQSSHHS
jgi:hypothetical protein